ncbi:MAG: hypothetical protein AAFP97_04460 [Pseudomonadota bacterium]
MSLKEAIKNVGMTVAPRMTMELLSARSQKLIMEIEQKRGRVDASKAYVREFGPAVTEGPFKGMVYPDMTIAERNLINKFIGAYEKQLYPWLETAVQKKPKKIVNIGSADGYYSVGLAMRCPDATVYSFDTDRWARGATQALADVNNVKNIEVLAYCDTKWLKGNIGSDTLLLIDCEGGEMQLADAKRIPNLLDADLVIELHDHVVPGIEEKIRSWYGETHTISAVDDPRHQPDAFPQLESVAPDMRMEVLTEGRGPDQRWLYLERQ